jgi:protocatechuate 3,4-dioxygenase beta subunit
MFDDDRPVGRVLTRREWVRLFGMSGAALSARAAAVSPRRADTRLDIQDCVAQPQQTEGPYFVDEVLERADVRVDPHSRLVSAGAPLALQFVVSAITEQGACAVLPGAQVDVWHCDAAGLYSGVRDARMDTTGQQFLRGYQVTDASGAVRFRTIYPGWYPGRAVHIHFKVRVPRAAGLADEFTSQLYFDDELTNRVHARPPYSAAKGQRLLNARDMIFREGGTQLMLPVVEAGDGYAATFRLAMRPGEPAPRGPRRPA